MSGIVAILNTHGAPCDGRGLRDLTQALVFRGPDGTGVEVSGEAGLGATLFRTTDESAEEAQPLSLDGQVWIVADCRVDDRAAFIARLRGAGEQAHASAPDVELILRAYRAWGTRCVEMLFGDFAFVIWDSRDRTLFAARDHFGVKPLFYANVGGMLILSNTLACIRRHPEVPADLDERAIGDFLMVGLNYFPASTAFRHIHRLAAAHRLRWSGAKLQVERYWQVPDHEEPLRLSRGEIIERFRDVLRSAVSDRLRTRVGALELSGGVDSTCVAATACDLKRRNAIDISLTAWTFDSRPLITGDREWDVARVTARALEIPHVSRSYNGYTLFRDAAGRSTRAQAEPLDLSLAATFFDWNGAIAESNRILLTGVGGDGVFAGEAPALRQLWRPDRCVTLAADAVSFTIRRHGFPPLGIRTGLKRLAGISKQVVSPLPAWIEPEFARKQCLEERWYDLSVPRQDTATTTVRPAATISLRRGWASAVEGCDAGWTGAPLDVRHPLLDLRVIDFLLRVPAVPWFWHKDLPRRAWRRLVPATVRNRPKTPLAGNRFRAALERGDDLPANWLHPSLRAYVRCEEVADKLRSVASLDAVQQWCIFYPISLSLWLQTLTRGS